MYPGLVEQLWKDRFKSLEIASCFDFAQYSILREDQQKAVVRALDQRLVTLVDALAEIGKVQEALEDRQRGIVARLQALVAQRNEEIKVIVDPEKTGDADLLYSGSTLFARIDDLFYAHTEPAGSLSQSLYHSQIRDPASHGVPTKENIIKWLQAEFGIVEVEDVQAWAAELNDDWADDARRWFRVGKEYVRFRTQIRLAGIEGHKKWVAQQRERGTPEAYSDAFAEVVYRREQDALDAIAAEVQAERERALEAQQQTSRKRPRRPETGSSSTDVLGGLEETRRAEAMFFGMLPSHGASIPGVSKADEEQDALARELDNFERAQKRLSGQR
jgi:hypothetical protein